MTDLSILFDPVSGQMGVLKPASTAALATDPSFVIAFSPNSPLPVGANVIGAVTQSGGPWSSNIIQIGGATLALGQKPMATSIPVAIASDQSAVPVSGTITTNQGTNPWAVQTSDVVATGSLNLAGDTVAVVMAGHAGAGYTINAGKTGTLVADASFDGGVTWQTTFLTNIGGSEALWRTSIALSGATVSGQIFSAAGASHVRLRLSANTGGSASPVTLTATIISSPLSSASFAALGSGTPPQQALLIGGYDPIAGLTYPIPLIGGGFSTRASLVDASSLAAAAIKNGSIAAVSTDPSLVVALSPNSPVPSGTNTIGTVNAKIASQADVDLYSLLQYSISQQADVLKAILVELKMMTIMTRQGLNIQDDIEQLRDDMDVTLTPLYH